MTADYLPGDEDWPVRTRIEGRGLEDAASENAYLEVAMELATEYGRLASLLVRSRPPAAEGRNAAILRGLATRVVKLTQRLTAESYEGRGELQAMLDHALFETTVDLAYLLRGGAGRYDAFILHTLRADRAVWDHLERNREEREGVSLPQERRMRFHLHRSFALAGMEPGDIDLMAESAWPGLSARLEAIGEPRAAAMHQLGSFAVRGLWNELVTHHLTDDETLDAELGWSRARVEPLFAMVIQGSRVMGGYAMRLSPALSDAFRDKFLDLARRAADADRHHELYLARADEPRGGPAG